jgi:hypothetical protein
MASASAIKPADTRVKLANYLHYRHSTTIATHDNPSQIHAPTPPGMTVPK